MNKAQIMTYFIDCLGHTEAEMLVTMAQQGYQDIIEYAEANDYYNNAVNYTLEQ